MSLKFAQLQSFVLAGAGVVLGDTEVTLSSFTSIDGVQLTMADFGTKGFMTLEPNSGTNEEQISFTGVTANINGTSTLTGISNVLFLSPYTETSGFSKTHAGGVKAVVSNTAGFYNTFANRLDDETIQGVWTFTQPNYPRMDNVFVDPTDPEQLVTKAYADGLTFAGAPNASTSVKGIVQEATVAELNAGTATGSTGALLFGSPADFAASIYGIQLPSSTQKNALAGDNGTPGTSNTYVTQSGFQAGAEIYGTDSVGTDAYAITPTPAVSAYTAGMNFYFKAGTANTGSVTLAVGSGAAKAIVKGFNTALVTGDILQNQVVQVSYNSTNDNWQMISPAAGTLTANALYTNGITTHDCSGTTSNVIAHGLANIPKFVRITGQGTDITNDSNGVYNGTTQSCIFLNIGSNRGSSSSFGINVSGGGSQSIFSTGIITFDSTNITITWTKTGSDTGTAVIMWEAYGPNT